MDIGCKELYWQVPEYLLRCPKNLWIEGDGFQLLSALRAAITADRAQRRSQEILAMRDRLFSGGCPDTDSVDYLLPIWNELTTEAEAAKAETGT